MKISREISVALLAAEKAGEFLRKCYYKSNNSYRLKKDKSMVTSADLAAERIILNIIRKHFPRHAILSEEKGRLGNISEYQWIIDPLDGSSYFFHRLPFFCVSIALVKNGQIIAAVVNNPITKELYWAEKGRGAYLNQKRIKVSKIKILAAAIVDLDAERNIRSEEKMARLYGQLHKLTMAKIRKNGALSLAYAASGHFEAFVSVNHHLWDCAPGILLVKEAGGRITDFKGRNFSLNKKQSFVASNKILHNKILNIINQ